MKWVIAATVAMAITATPALARVQTAEVIVVRDFAAVSTCTALGEVRGSSMMGGILATAAYDKAIRLMKERAAALGATHVQIIDSASGFAGARMIGTAFKCAPDKPTPEPPPT